MAQEKYERIRRTINVLSEQEGTNPETLERLIQQAQEMEDEDGVDGETLPGYTEEDKQSWTLRQKTFAQDMEESGFRVYQYHGRFFYKGPAVKVTDLQEGIRGTGIKVQWDSMGLGYVVYPQ